MMVVTATAAFGIGILYLSLAIREASKHHSSIHYEYLVAAWFLIAAVLVK